MVPVPRWWLNRSRAERFDISLRWPLYALCCAEFFLALLITFGTRDFRPAAVVVFLLIALAHTVVNLLVLRAGIAQYLGGTRVSNRLVATAVALTVAGVPAAALAFPSFRWTGEDSGIRDLTIVLLVGALLFALTPMLRPSALLALILLGAVVNGALSVRVGPALVNAYSLGCIVFACRITVWTLSLGWEIDRSRALTAQLAIAEERLRFGRDLHDTLGRNLSLVAVQSELAAALANRGDPKAAEQMLDVRRIAHDSLREMRAVVGGYRATDLTTELAGAQSVLRSAGVNCRVIGDGSALLPATQAALGWVVREGTTNVIRHTNATTCKIELDHSPAGTVLRMDNDGVSSSTSNGGGMGITGLRERLAELGGTLTVDNPPGRFVLVARLPVVA
ncbi:histidine kinase [Kribbella sp. NPDC023855]|uniref:sensor histidine kinase n=1 Tax=Kribbella sp. NPDC023855 TaxID=3154698 RepID=UPI003403EB22